MSLLLLSPPPYESGPSAWLTLDTNILPDLEPWGRKWTRRRRLALPTYVTPPVCRALLGVPYIVSLAIRLRSTTFESCTVCCLP